MNFYQCICGVKVKILDFMEDIYMLSDSQIMKKWVKS